ncbi:hypothetical protein TTHERM_00263430 (macronuclear) [Tetrahymena thermophila SB210]|uniref:Uncharacterized protein n=1 Tax=Tetrahymena thermophila (strain SB210) TaxID=312017 RepID=Q22U40_TETTS|nr:hypothetical protein TTHERM_00263430 [Tetrahymena thermophila SB210]EAR88847.2 hypothetical protein TTHERM_00263430 [Tetrahymena thermophila SB210]|eukprot:XP_001009092.2 hypothetical protein TTHERM_00263430 [Tetrahymena thermophila SB210]
MYATILDEGHFQLKSISNKNKFKQSTKTIQSLKNPKQYPLLKNGYQQLEEDKDLSLEDNQRSHILLFHKIQSKIFGMNPSQILYDLYGMDLEYAK